VNDCSRPKVTSLTTNADTQKSNPSAAPNARRRLRGPVF
jgi:hypothetical protein